MINTQLMFEGKIPNGSKDQGQGHQFSNPSETLRCSIKSLIWEVKFKMVQFLSVKIQIF